MKNLLSLLAVALLASPAAVAQSRVAAYAFGKPGTNGYERISFWVKDGQRAGILYARGRGDVEVKGLYLPRVGSANGASFSVKLPSERILTVVPNGTQLNVGDSAGRAPKTFTWEYEGPVNGVGTFCRECAENAEEAMQLVRAHFLK